MAILRHKLQRIPPGQVLFLDETHLRVSEAPLHTLVAPGATPFIVVDDTTKYAKRYDMIACCTSKEVLPPIIFAPNEREKGINVRMLISYIHNILAQACGALDRYPLTLVIDKATIHNTHNILQAFHDNGCQDLVEVILMPTQAAKRMSPLDNAIFHDWKEIIRHKERITETNIKRLMSDAWNKIKPATLTAHYRHCLLNRGQDPYADCPLPAVHRH